MFASSFVVVFERTSDPAFSPFGNGKEIVLREKFTSKIQSGQSNGSFAMFAIMGGDEFWEELLLHVRESESRDRDI